jgi:hypothetical protein
MADYPTLTQRIGTTVEVSSGIRVSRAASGKPRFSRFSTQDWYVFKVLHDTNAAGLAALEAHYTAHRMLEFSFTFSATAETYLVQYAESLKKQAIEGEDRFIVESLLVGTGRLPFGVAVVSLVGVVAAAGYSSQKRAAVTVSCSSSVTVARKKNAKRFVIIPVISEVEATGT